MTRQWEKQKQELDSYNVFYSCIKGLDADTGLLDLGFRVVGNFLRITDNRQDVEANPDVVLYNNETLLLVEIKSGNSVEPRDKNQMERMGQISIEEGQNFLKDTELNDPLLEPTELSDIQPLIVYPLDTVLSCRNSDGCISRMEEIGEFGAVLSQEKDGYLEYQEGNISDNALRATLNQGISLPKHPDTSIYLTENTDREILSYSICMDLVRPQFHTTNTVEIQPNDVYERYRGREIKRRKLIDALDFLDQIGACTSTSTNIYTFRKKNIAEIMGVTEKLDKKRVTEWLSGEADKQRSLEDFSAPIQADSDN